MTVRLLSVQSCARECPCACASLQSGGNPGLTGVWGGPGANRPQARSKPQTAEHQRAFTFQAARWPRSPKGGGTRADLCLPPLVG